MVKIKANNKTGFRRCGVFHPPEWVEHDDKAFSEADLERLKAEPMLTVAKKAEADASKTGEAQPSAAAKKSKK